MPEYLELNRPLEARRLVDSLRRERDVRMDRWRRLSRFICPWRGRFDVERGGGFFREESRIELFTHAASQACLKSASGMTSGISPRNIAWFKPRFTESGLNEQSGARQWLDELEAAMMACLAEGGFYQAIQNFNMDLIWSGCALLRAERGRGESLMEFSCCQAGTYFVKTDSQGRLEAVAIVSEISVNEAAGEFGEENLSARTKAQLKKNPFEMIRVWHLTRPIPKARQKEGGFTQESFWWEDGGQDKFLKKSGYYEAPWFFTVWHEGETSYGTGPGDWSLADAMQMDQLERRKLAGLGKLVDPPVLAPLHYKDALDLDPGGVNYVQSRETIAPILDLAPYASALGGILQEISTVAQRLDSGLMASIFSSMPLNQRPAGMSATEFLERKREALQLMGPVMSSYEPRVLAPLLMRVALTLDREGALPQAPESLNGLPLFMRMEFISPMSNALRQSAAETARALFQDVALMYKATGKDELFDKIDLDQLVDELAQGLGAPGSIVRADEDVAKIRQQRAQFQLQARQAQAFAEGANIDGGIGGEAIGASGAGLEAMQGGMA